MREFKKSITEPLINSRAKVSPKAESVLGGSTVRTGIGGSV